MTIIRVILSLLWPFFFASIALGFPETLRHGYQSCSSCHTTAGGGGQLTPYGRMTGAQALATVATRAPGYPDWYALGLNYRRANVNVDVGGERFHQKIEMQTEAELTLQLVKGLTVSGTFGFYGNDHRQEFRRNYIQLEPVAGLRVRGGRFIPSYGIGTPVHTDTARQLLDLGQGNERLSAEVSAVTPWGDVIVTRTFGQEVEADANRGGYTVYEDPEDEVFAKGDVYLAETYRLGLSGRWTRGYLSAVAATVELAPVHWGYLLSEFGTADPATRETYSSSKLGVEPLKGLHVALTYEHSPQTPKIGGQVQWFPVYGVDTLVKLAQTNAKSGPPARELTAILHLFL